VPQVSLDEIEATTRTALERHGAEGWIAAEVARAVRKAESIGNRICGLYYLESYCVQLRSGRVKGDAEPVVTHPRPGAVHVDAGYGFAQSEGLIALGMTNASPIVAPPGGKTRVIGTNPIAFSVPDGQGGIAMQFDQSTTTVALGKITMAKAAGERIPEGWAVDAAGNPTTDPAAALTGSLVSTGGAKGWGFGLMAELLAAGMTGGVASRDVKPLKAPDGPPHDLGQYYLLMDPGTSPDFFARLEQVAEGVALDEGARMPGQGKQPQDPVTLEEAVWAQTRELAGL